MSLSTIGYERGLTVGSLLQKKITIYFLGPKNFCEVESGKNLYREKQIIRVRFILRKTSEAKTK